MKNFLGFFLLICLATSSVAAYAGQGGGKRDEITRNGSSPPPQASNECGKSEAQLGDVVLAFPPSTQVQNFLDARNPCPPKDYRPRKLTSSDTEGYPPLRWDHKICMEDGTCYYHILYVGVRSQNVTSFLNRREKLEEAGVDISKLPILYGFHYYDVERPLIGKLSARQLYFGVKPSLTDYIGEPIVFRCFAGNGHMALSLSKKVYGGTTPILGTPKIKPEHMEAYVAKLKNYLDELIVEKADTDEHK